MRQPIVIVCSLAGAFLFLSQPVQAEDTTYTAKDSLGNSAFTAIFDAVLGERITAVSSAIGCTITVDEAQKEGSATCSVPLTSIMVDNEPTKTEHFQEWTTNKKSEATECTLELDIPKVSVDRALEAKKSTKFSAEGTFTICGRGREGGEPEAISGSIVYLPPGAYGKNPTLRVRAKIEKFNREEYGISPAATSGWLARVQQLAPVVSAEGTIEVNIFATAPLKETAQKKSE